MAQNTYPGMMALNGVVETDTVRAYFIGSSIHLSDGTKDFRCNKELVVSPFGAASLTYVSPKSALGKLSYPMSAREWQIAGTGLGAFSWGPLGHPGDGEFELRPVKSFNASALYSPKKVALDFAGRTEAGLEVCYFAQTVERLNLAPWDFHVQFEVSRERLQEFLGVPVDWLNAFLKRLDNS